MDSELMRQLKMNSSKPVRVTRKGILFGDEQFPYAVEEGSIKVEQLSRKLNKLTLTIIVGEVTVEATGFTEDEINGVVEAERDDETEWVDPPR